MYISIDLGGTNTRVASSKDLETIYKVDKFSTQDNLKDQRERITQAIKNVLDGEDEISNIKSICVGVPGIINKKENKFDHIVNATYLSNLEFIELFEPELANVKFIGENDAALAALGEAVFGAGKDFETMAYLTISTAVGGARISNKKLDLTQRFSEPGHHIIDVGGPADTKVHLHGTLEAYVSGTAFERNYGISPKQCENQEIWDDYGQKLSNGLINICAFWAPDAVILGGGVANQFHRFINSLEKHFKLQDFFEMPVIKVVELGDNAGLYGGLALIKQLEE